MRENEEALRAEGEAVAVAVAKGVNGVAVGVNGTTVGGVGVEWQGKRWRLMGRNGAGARARGGKGGRC